MPAYQPISERLLDKVSFNPATHCMTFTGSLCEDGYGKINGGKDLPGETLAHRAAYRIWCGEIEVGMEIDHRCRHRACINPQHLWLVTHRVNASMCVQGDEHRNRRKTHCIHGHLFDEKNTIRETWKGRARRKCRACTNERQSQNRKKALVETIYPAVRIIET